MNQGLRLVSGSTREADIRKHNSNMVKDVQARVPVPPSEKPGISTWVKWVLGSVLSILLSFWKQKWERVRGLEGKVEKIVGEVEQVAEVVEKVATVTEKISVEVAEQLPDNSMMNAAALVVEHISSVTAAGAQLTKNFIQKIEDVKQDLKDLETMVEPVIDDIIMVEVEPHKKY